LALSTYLTLTSCLDPTQTDIDMQQPILVRRLYPRQFNFHNFNYLHWTALFKGMQRWWRLWDIL